jgi:hypothetical protein
VFPSIDIYSQWICNLYYEYMFQWILGKKRENLRQISQLALIVWKVKPTQVS